MCAYVCASKSAESISGSRRYDQVCYLTSHNSYAASDHGYIYAQQSLTIEKQLEFGVRALMLDIGLENDTIVLIHKNPFITRLLRAGKSPLPFQSALTTVKEFLEHHPSEVLTIFLENYVNTDHHLDQAFREAQLASFIFTPHECHSLSGDQWPTLGWMRAHNKRLIIFNSLGETQLCFNQWQQVIENRWGTLHEINACHERYESKRYKDHPRTLFFLNYFPFLNGNGKPSYAKINTEGLTRFLKRALVLGLDTASQGSLLPNFICVDFIEEGDASSHVSHLNLLHEGSLIDKRRPHLLPLITLFFCPEFLTNLLFNRILEKI